MSHAPRASAAVRRSAAGAHVDWLRAPPKALELIDPVREDIRQVNACSPRL
jgi:hypothetical protein